MRRYGLARRRAGRGVPFRWVLVLMVTAALCGWWMGKMEALPERDAIVLPVYRHDLDEVVPMSLEEYVMGVVAAEMPANFHLEALKAQAVAARTLALHLLQENRPLADHPEAVISTDFRTHQAWKSPEAAREEWGISFYWRWAKIAKAVSATRGIVMMYGDEVIYPAYHASSGGRTEDSENYWTSYMPYLRSVDDPYSAQDRYAQTEAVIAKSELWTAIARRGGGAATVLARAGEATGDARVESPARDHAEPESLTVEILSRYPSGRVERVRVGDVVMTGRELRETLGLRSNWFDVEDRGGSVRFLVRGYGHGIGMSQYGADAMARAGFTFDQILSHYYTGVEIVNWYD